MQNDNFNDTVKIAVIGGGAAGMMAAGTATTYGAEVTIFESTDRLGKKLAITGKGRCNVTNNCTREEFLENVTKNSRFLYAALSAFSCEDTMSFFESTPAIVSLYSSKLSVSFALLRDKTRPAP